MSLAIQGLGTALPAHRISQERAAAVARRLCGRGADQGDALQKLYRQSGIDARHFAIDAAVVQDILDGTRLSESVFLPCEDGQGPTTGKRMQYYAERALPLALQAARQA